MPGQATHPTPYPDINLLLQRLHSVYASADRRGHRLERTDGCIGTQLHSE
jgi:hypothetical protein